MGIVLQQLFNGIMQGCTYSLIAIGYAMIFSALRKMNFSHSDVCMTGAMVAYTGLGFIIGSSDNMWMQILLGLGIGMVSSACVGFVIEKVAFKTLRFAPNMANCLATIGFGYVLKELARQIWGSDTKKFVQNLSWLKVYRIESINLTITNLQIILLLTGVLLIIFLQIIIYKTTMGRAIRAISMDQKASQLMGINLDKVISITYMISSALSGAAGVMLGFYYRAASPYMGSMPGTKAFAAIVLGGLTSIPGAAIGGVFLGVAENVGGMLLGDHWRDGIAYLIFFIFLVIKPQGLFGEKTDEKRKRGLHQ